MTYLFWTWSISKHQYCYKLVKFQQFHKIAAYHKKPTVQFFSTFKSKLILSREGTEIWKAYKTSLSNN